MSEVTYGQVDRVLRSRGFSRRVATFQTKAAIYEHQPTGALVVLPEEPDEARVSPEHLAIVRGTLDVFGIAAPRELETELQKVS